MGLRKIFRKVTRPIRKIIPKEIRPFVPYAASMFLPGIPGLPAAFAKYGGNEFLKAALTRGVVDEDADFRDVLRTGITAALPKLVETGASSIAKRFPGKFEPAKYMKADGTTGGIESATYDTEGVIENLMSPEKFTPSKIGQVAEKVASSAGKLTSGSGLENFKSKATFGITAGSMDSAKAFLDNYNENFDDGYSRSDDRPELFKIFKNANWGTDDEINDMLDRYGYMGGGSVMPIQTGIAGALPMPNTRPGYDMGGDVLMASNAQNDEILERLFEEYLDMGFSPEDAAKKAREAFDNMSQGQGIKGTQVASGYKTDIEDMYEQYVFEMEEQGLQPMSFSEFLAQARSGMAHGGSIHHARRMEAGGLMNRNLLNTGMDKDMRGGGFIPEGTKEKADDVPARLSKNEFVMTADAVRAAGGGSVNEGAKRMYDTMHRLEAKV